MPISKIHLNYFEVNGPDWNAIEDGQAMEIIHQIEGARNDRTGT